MRGWLPHSGQSHLRSRDPDEPPTLVGGIGPTIRYLGKVHILRSSMEDLPVQVLIGNYRHGVAVPNSTSSRRCLPAATLLAYIRDVLFGSSFSGFNHCELLSESNTNMAFEEATVSMLYMIARYLRTLDRDPFAQRIITSTEWLARDIDRDRPRE
jgi:hypothetical protein